MHKITTLKNGLRIITVPQKNSQAVTILVLVGTGSKYETKETSGISHFLEHLYFKGTKKRPTPLAVAEELDKLGGIFNAFTGEEYTGYFAKVDALHFETALDWVSDIYLNSLLPSKEIEKERGVIIEEINMYLDTPMIYVGELWKTLLYGDQPAGWDIAGTKETIGRISKEQILDYRKSQYVASNTIVCVAGKIDSPKIISQIKKYFSRIRTTQPQKKLPVVEKQNKPQILLSPKKTDQTHLILGVRTFNILHPDHFILEILGIILGGMMSSRLFVEVREKLGLAYYVKTDNEADPDAGYLITRAGVDNRRVDKAISTILKEYKKISEKKVSLSELKKAKDNFKGKLSLLLEPSDAKASFYAGQELLEKRILTPKEMFNIVDKITTDDILKVAKAIFRPERLNLALIGPTKDKAKFQQLLKL
ncbi:MAG: pitrilysin family protein [Candidatus Pacebacteria bacterium]|nr:pitrilysin family protein [Candidatus Paceibacterota bacterium]